MSTQSKVKQYAATLTMYLRSMQVAVNKAKRGSVAEDIYFTEKLEKTARVMGYKLVEKD